MTLPNVDDLLMFYEDARGHMETLEQLGARYRREPEGTNFYIDLTSANVAPPSQIPR